MQFELTEALIDEILFSMEDQEGEFYIDTKEGVVGGGYDSDAILDDQDEDEDGWESGRFISLPQWDSASGFRLMERFTTGLKNPLIREELNSALNRGRGVFRAFKDTLGRYPEIEKAWFVFKEKEMKLAIKTWYNGLREEWGMEKIGIEPEETDDLVLEDFRFRPFIEEDIEKAKGLHELCRKELANIPAEKGIKNSFEAIIREAHAFGELKDNLFSSPPALPPMAAITAESGGGEFAGYISGIAKGGVFYIQYLEVKPEYRGLGIGETLLNELLDILKKDKISQVLMDIPFWADNFSRVLIRESFMPYTERYCLDLSGTDK